jgi:7,8-dihydropterin-6-yl-methyl-4-(beta-D-ribofuranosyl)aminobenzene 5'-phosphate synthase
MEYSILVEDHKRAEGIKAEHGLSIYFSAGGKKILFDTGQSDLFQVNAGKMGIDLSDLDYVVLSHGHYDHTGGLRFLPEECKAILVAHPDYCFPKYDGKRSIGIPAEAKLETWLSQTSLDLAEGVFFLGEIPGVRKTFGQCVGADGVTRDDPLFDDTGLVVLEGGRAVVLCGCAHSGIVNIAKYVKKLCGPEEMVLVGGFHLHESTEKEIVGVIDELKALKVSAVYCGHCTGKKATELLLEEFGGEELYSGMRIDL